MTVTENKEIRSSLSSGKRLARFRRSPTSLSPEKRLVHAPEDQEPVICGECGQSYPAVETNRVWFGNEAFLKCPYCGTTNIGVVMKPESQGVPEQEYDVDEEEWLKENPEQEDHSVE